MPAHTESEDRTGHHLVENSDLPRDAAVRADRRAHEIAVAADAQKEELVARRERVQGDVTGVAGPLLLLAGTWLLTSQGWAFPDAPSSEWATVWTGGAATVLILVSMRAFLAGLSLVSAAFGLVAGAGVLLYGVLGDHGGSATGALVAGGLLALVGTLAGLDPRGRD